METGAKRHMSIMERLAEIIILRINKVTNKEGLELQKMKLGMEILLINISKFLIVFFVAFKINLIIEAFIIMIVFAALRSNAFGIHSKSSIACTITTLLLFVGGGYLSHYFLLSRYIVFLIFMIINVLLYQYAPADTEYHPLLGQAFRKSLRNKAVIIGVTLMVIALIVPSETIRNLITLASCAEVISILPITYKVLNRRYRNYEGYEKATIN
ncbi:accessory gene regulator B family protein [Clostridium sp. 'White wine YQ']|uniref:accessory gene regulator B family protein n=1 Tax=Clostridium sp. 'White wine YQ' TaxID=3027474 RepID=UPI00236583CD|nr:accessory gene regulator B family protein [Clostridium sp. 'White wine YQ']MDD7795016.1 accessory gene regulator B family protein [Clostridium sp. 'White wine YQ']